jgi:hypothetical protein
MTWAVKAGQFRPWESVYLPNGVHRDRPFLRPKKPDSTSLEPYSHYIIANGSALETISCLIHQLFLAQRMIPEIATILKKTSLR